MFTKDPEKLNSVAKAYVEMRKAAMAAKEQPEQPKPEEPKEKGK